MVSRAAWYRPRHRTADDLPYGRKTASSISTRCARRSVRSTSRPTCCSPHGLRRGAWDAACCTLRVARNDAVRRVSVCAIQCARTADRMRLYPHACAEGGGGGGGGVCAHAGDLGDRMCVRAFARARCVWMVWAEVRRGVRGERSVPMTRECLAAPRSPEPNCVGTGRPPMWREMYGRRRAYNVQLRQQTAMPCAIDDNVRCAALKQFQHATFGRRHGEGAAQKRHIAPKRRDDINTKGADHIDAERGTVARRAAESGP